MNGSRLLRPIAALLLAACGLGDKSAAGDAGGSASARAASAAGSSQADEGLNDVTKYRLTLDKMDRFVQAQRNLYRKLKDMSPAEREAAKIRTDAGESLDDMVAKVDRSPVLKAAIMEAGMSTREYTVFTIAMVEAIAAEAILDMGPNVNQDSLIRRSRTNIENLRFLRDNKAEIERRQKALEAAAKELGAQ